MQRKFVGTLIRCLQSLGRRLDAPEFVEAPLKPGAKRNVKLEALEYERRAFVTKQFGDPPLRRLEPQQTAAERFGRRVMSGQGGRWNYAYISQTILVIILIGARLTGWRMRRRP
jgi:hypothetical protein